MTDWYDTETDRQMNFQHRSAVSGLYIKLLKNQVLSRCLFG
jgi:hypothetical protein